MAQSINTKIDIVVDATSYLGITGYGKIMVGDKGFEFYDDRNVENYIQIPWSQIDYVVASVLFGGRWIPRFAIETKKDGTLTFSAKKVKELLKAINKYIDTDHMVRSLSFFQVVKRGVKSIFKK